MMKTKKRSPRVDPTEAYIKIRERKRWQMGFRRYVVEGVPSEYYAPYFGLDGDTLRKWFELQFSETLSWENFGESWQFDHIVPVVYFDFSKEEDLLLCWNFINIRVEPLQLNKNRGNRIDVLAVKAYFEKLYSTTKFSVAEKMIRKINEIEVSNIESNANIENFIVLNKERLENIATLNKYEFNQFNQGVPLEHIMLEKRDFKKIRFLILTIDYNTFAPCSKNTML